MDMSGLTINSNGEICISFNGVVRAIVKSVYENGFIFKVIK